MEDGVEYLFPRAWTCGTNWIKVINIPEIVLIPVDPKWDWIDEPIYCKKTNSEMTQDKKTSLFILKNDQLEDGKIDLQLISSVAMMENYLMDVNYMFDYEKLSEYCMKYWMGK